MVEFVPIFPETGEFDWDTTCASYKKLDQELKKNPKDLKAINDNIGVLQHYIFSIKDLIVDTDIYSDEEIFQNKEQAALKVIDIVEALKDHDILHMVYLAVTAQNCIITGDWDSAIDCYNQILTSDGVLDAEYDANYYTGELELAAKVVHNIGTLYFVGLKGADALQIREKYKYLFDLENQRYTRLMRRNPEWATRFKTEFDDLDDFTRGIIYYNTSFAYDIQTDGSMLAAICSDCKKNKEKYITELDEQIQLVNKGIRLYVIDNSIGFQGQIITKILPLSKFKEHRKDSSSTSNKKDEPKNEPLEVKPSLDDILLDLETLVGLAQVKKEVSSLINLLKIQNIRKQKGLPEFPISRHLVFSGNPGTGKTTVARLLAQIYHELGILSKGQLIEVDRSGLVGGYVGQTAIKTQGVIQQALGGVLFIDEAYTLARGNDSNDYGQEAIDIILKAMEDHRDDLVVIVAGYPDLMERFINSNPGLKSRFNKYIHFEDYTPEELLEIFDSMCKKAGLTATRTARNWVLHVFTEEYENRDETFANGREVRNFFEKAVVNQANRLANEAYLNDEDVSTLTAEDVIVE